MIQGVFCVKTKMKKNEALSQKLLLKEGLDYFTAQ